MPIFEPSLLSWDFPALQCEHIRDFFFAFIRLFRAALSNLRMVNAQPEVFI